MDHSNTSNWNELLFDRRFWGWYYVHNIGLGDEDVDGLNGIQRLNEYWKSVFGVGFDVPLPSFLRRPFEGKSLEILLRGYRYSVSFFFGDDPASVHALQHPNWTKKITLGYNDPHFHLPFLRWIEIQKIVDQAENKLPKCVLAMILLQGLGVGPDEDTSAIRSGTEGWLRQSGLFSKETAHSLAAALTKPGPKPWEYDDMIGFVHGSPYSHRNPEEHHWKHYDFERFREFTRAIGTE